MSEPVDLVLPSAAEVAAWLSQWTPAFAVDAEDDWEFVWSPALSVQPEESCLRVRFVDVPGRLSDRAGRVVALATARVRLGDAGCPWPLGVDPVDQDDAVVAEDARSSAVSLRVYAVTAQEAQERRAARDEARAARRTAQRATAEALRARGREGAGGE